MLDFGFARLQLPVNLLVYLTNRASYLVKAAFTLRG
jgi:hypothetical protein